MGGACFNELEGGVCWEISHGEHGEHGEHGVFKKQDFGISFLFLGFFLRGLRELLAKSAASKTNP
jgi:hypothetical protein